jgi:spore coat polysaccharide biosynthesis predicted glycosyltransferase SpsG
MLISDVGDQRRKVPTITMESHRIIIRVECGPYFELGTGHLMRCLRLASLISKKIQVEITFVTTTPEYFKNLLPAYTPNAILKSFDSSQFQQIMEFYADYSPHVVISDLNLKDNIDDYIRAIEKVPYHVNLAEPHLNHFPFGLVVFASILPVKPKCSCESKAEYLVGSRYLLIDPRFREIKPANLSANQPLNILITPGGADPSNATEKILDILEQSHFDPSIAHFTLVTGHAKQNRDSIFQKAAQIASFKVIDSPTDIIDLLTDSHLVICSGGTTAYEAIAAGRPSWIIPQIEFEEKVARILLKKQCLIGFGFSSFRTNLIQRLPYLQRNFDIFKPIIESGHNIIDGKGLIRVADKIVDALKAIKNHT